ncbi:hypothetical protein R6Q59_008576 [Mikania micrantha]
MYIFCLYQLNEASVIDARATPPAIGKREVTTHGVGIYPYIPTNTGVGASLSLIILKRKNIKNKVIS